MKAIILSAKEDQIKACQNHIIEAGGEIVAICREPNDLQELVNDTFDTVVSYYPITHHSGPNVYETGVSFNGIRRIFLHERKLPPLPRDLPPETWDKALSQIEKAIKGKIE